MKPMHDDPEMLEEYDFRGGVRGKYAERFARGTNIVVLDPDVAATFRTSAEVNSALREVLRARQAQSEQSPGE
jgi:hypothetical protein